MAFPLFISPHEPIMYGYLITYELLGETLYQEDFANIFLLTNIRSVVVGINEAVIVRGLIRLVGRTVSMWVKLRSSVTPMLQ